MFDKKSKGRQNKNFSSKNLTENVNLTAGLSADVNLSPGWTLEPEESVGAPEYMSDHETPDSDPWYRH